MNVTRLLRPRDTGPLMRTLCHGAVVRLGVDSCCPRCGKSIEFGPRYDVMGQMRLW